MVPLLVLISPLNHKQRSKNSLEIFIWPIWLFLAQRSLSPRLSTVLKPVTTVTTVLEAGQMSHQVTHKYLRLIPISVSLHHALHMEQRDQWVCPVSQDGRSSLHIHPCWPVSTKEGPHLNGPLSLLSLNSCAYFYLEERTQRNCVREPTSSGAD